MAARPIPPMIEALHFASAAVLALMLAISVVNLFTAPRLARWRGGASSRRISLLIPARDEADNLRRLLPRLLAGTDGTVEVLVYDDGSRDATAELVRSISRQDPRVRLLTGEPPPPGWVGKNWACDKLVREAPGEILIFCDADVAATGTAVTATAAAIENGFDAVTALPRHRLIGLVPSATVPLIAQLPIIALLPLWLVPRTRSPAVAVGNGQWLAFRRETYDRIGGHAAVAGEILEDMALARRVKVTGGRLLAAVAPDLLAVQMYGNTREVVMGFGKNLYQLLGARSTTFAAGLVVFYLAAIHPLLALTAGEWLPFALLGGVRFCERVLVRTPFRSFLLHPLGAAVTPWIAFRSLSATHRGTVLWRGRPVPRSSLK